MNGWHGQISFAHFIKRIIADYELFHNVEEERDFSASAKDYIDGIAGKC